jgi:hypothetical protein
MNRHTTTAYECRHVFELLFVDPSECDHPNGDIHYCLHLLGGVVGVHPLAGHSSQRLLRISFFKSRNKLNFWPRKLGAALSSLALMKRFLWASATDGAFWAALHTRYNPFPWCSQLSHTSDISVTVLWPSFWGHRSVHPQRLHFIFPTKSVMTRRDKIFRGDPFWREWRRNDRIFICQLYYSRHAAVFEYTTQYSEV